MARARIASRPGDPQPARPPRRAADRADLRRHHRRQLRLRRAAGAAGAEHRHGERGFRRGEPGRGRVPARQHLLPHPQDRGGRVRVEDAQGMPPSIPFWLGEAPGRSDELSSAVARLRGEIDQRLASAESQAAERLQPVIDWLADTPGIPREAAQQIVEYLSRARSALGALPTQRRLIMERFFDESGGTQLVIHSPWQPHQPCLGPGAAQALLPHLQLRAAGGSHRGRDHPRCRPVTASRWMRSGATCIRPVPNRC